jgi:hypothetical protein
VLSVRIFNRLHVWVVSEYPKAGCPLRLDIVTAVWLFWSANDETLSRYCKRELRVSWFCWTNWR